MKRILSALAILGVFAGGAIADGGNTAPTAPTYGVRDWDIVEMDVDADNDTINGTSDSSMLKEDWSPNPGYEYWLYLAAPTDGGTGVPEFIVTLRAEDRAGNMIKIFTLIDTFTAADGGGFCTLPIGQTGAAYQYDLWLDAGAANGAADHELNQWGIIRSREIFPTSVKR